MSFNKMTRDLRDSREQLEFSARILRRAERRDRGRRQYMEIVLKNVSAGVITLDADGLITTVNKSAEKMLDLNAADILHRKYAESADRRPPRTGRRDPGQVQEVPGGHGGDVPAGEHLRPAADLSRPPQRPEGRNRPSPGHRHRCSMISPTWKKRSAWRPGARWPGGSPMR